MSTPRLHNRHGNFTLVPNGFVFAKVSHESFRLYVVLLSHVKGNAADGGVVFPDYERLKNITGIKSYSTIAKCIRELESAGWVERKRRFGDSTLYTLTSPTPDVVMEATSPTPDVASVLHGVESSPTRRVGQSYTPSKTNNTQVTRHKKQDGKNGASAPRPHDPLFDAIAELTKSSPALQGSHIAKVANELKAVGATPEQVVRFGKWWALCDWRGIKGDLPLLTQITPMWQRAIEWDGARPKLPAGAPRSNGRTHMRGQVQYTDEQRRAAEEQARRELAGEEAE